MKQLAPRVLLAVLTFATAACGDPAGAVDADHHTAPVAEGEAGLSYAESASEATGERRLEATVALVTREPFTGRFNWGRCTGSLLSPTVVLTAAHCVVGLADGQMGVTRVDDLHADDLAPEDIVAVRRSVMHPLYQSFDMYDEDGVDFHIPTSVGRARSALRKRPVRTAHGRLMRAEVLRCAQQPTRSAQQSCMAPLREFGFMASHCSLNTPRVACERDAQAIEAAIREATSVRRPSVAPDREALTPSQVQTVTQIRAQCGAPWGSAARARSQELCDVLAPQMLALIRRAIPEAANDDPSLAQLLVRFDALDPAVQEAGLLGTWMWPRGSLVPQALGRLGEDCKADATCRDDALDAALRMTLAQPPAGSHVATLEPSPWVRHDIALVFLKRPLVDVNFPFARLPSSEQNKGLRPGIALQMSGYGRNVAPFVELEADASPEHNWGIRLVGSARIERLFPRMIRRNDRFGSTSVKCRGDSGGPSYANTAGPGQPADWRLVGITQGVDMRYPVALSCAAGGHDTRVGAYLGWLYSTRARFERDATPGFGLTAAQQRLNLIRRARVSIAQSRFYVGWQHGHLAAELALESVLRQVPVDTFVDRLNSAQVTRALQAFGAEGNGDAGYFVGMASHLMPRPSAVSDAAFARVARTSPDFSEALGFLRGRDHAVVLHTALGFEDPSPMNVRFDPKRALDKPNPSLLIRPSVGRASLASALPETWDDRAVLKRMLLWTVHGALSAAQQWRPALPQEALSRLTDAPVRAHLARHGEYDTVDELVGAMSRAVSGRLHGAAMSHQKRRFGVALQQRGRLRGEMLKLVRAAIAQPEAFPDRP